MSKIESSVIVYESCVLCFSYTDLTFFWINYLWFRFSICLTVDKIEGCGGRGREFGGDSLPIRGEEGGWGEHDINLSFLL
jgi:hypothetical protein